MNYSVLCINSIVYFATPPCHVHYAYNGTPYFIPRIYRGPWRAIIYVRGRKILIMADRRSAYMISLGLCILRFSCHVVRLYKQRRPNRDIWISVMKIIPYWLPSQGNKPKGCNGGTDDFPFL